MNNGNNNGKYYSKNSPRNSSSGSRVNSTNRGVSQNGYYERENNGRATQRNMPQRTEYNQYARNNQLKRPTDNVRNNTGTNGAYGQAQVKRSRQVNPKEYNDPRFEEMPERNTTGQNIRYRNAYEHTINNMRKPRKKINRESTGKKILKGIGKTFAFILTFVAILTATLFVCLKLMCTENHPWIVQTFLETGQMKFIPSLFLSDEDVQKIIDSNAMGTLDTDIDNDLIKIGDTSNMDLSEEEKSWGDIEIFEVKGSTYYGTMIYVKDPSRISVGSIYPWRDEGITLEQLVNDCGALGGINGGLYNSYNNSGGAPFGVLVSNGEIQLNDPQGNVGFVLIGFTEENMLQIIDISKMTPDDIVNLVAEKHIRDAVTFQEENSDANNHFVQLIINGETRELSGAGSGLNPRTAIGQRADGSMLLLVTDGRGKNGHAGASALDLINIMAKYGAVNAANLDGGSSSCMYYNGEYLMDSVTFYYSNTSWKLPAGFIIK